MTRRIKKPTTKPEERRAWLRRNEEEGESPPQIAAKDGYDVRTVRKQIEMAKQERETREARSLVLRNALESHYRDLCKYAEGLSSMIMGEDKYSLPTPDAYMESALRQHLPRSPIWKDLIKWRQLQEKLSHLEDEIKSRLKEESKHDKRLDPILASGSSQVITGLAEVITFQAKAWAQHWSGINIKDHFKPKPAENGWVSVGYGSFGMGNVKEEHVAQLKEVLGDFELKITSWEQFESMQKSFADLSRVKSALQDELAIITHRRIVPGKCKYCPI